MKPTIEILEKISQNSAKNKNEVFTRIYRYLLREDIYYIAYKRLYSNKGAGTKGINNDTADGFSQRKILNTIKMLKEGTYTPNPVRRTYLKKQNGKMRPLGIPTFTDKLVQKVLRMILEAIYEPIFLETSHGFRPNRSCHTALKDIRKRFNGTRWFVEGDIKGCFDNIDHSVLVGLINLKIKDARISQLIYKFLKAGYLEDWKYNNSYSGTPQGGIISPILSNIYLNELDKFIENLKAKFDKPPVSLYTPEYNKLRVKLEHLRYRNLKNANDNTRPAILEQITVTRAEMMKTPSKSQTDKKIKYVRYADDFLIGVNGDRTDCEWIKAELKNFIGNTLKMELSEEKTLITHSNTYARFLGYDVRIRRNNQLKRTCNGFTKRTISNNVEMNIPTRDKLEKFLFNHQAVVLKNGKLEPCLRKSMLRMTDLEILTAYNAELRGIANYYCMASNFNDLNYFSYLMEYSCLKTLAGKHQSTISKIRKKYNFRGKWCIPYETKQGIKQMYFAKYQDCKKAKDCVDTISNSALKHSYTVTTFESRLKAKKCELCGCENSDEYEIHHINKVKNLKGKELWEKVMIAKRRKTIVVCKKCHKEIHKIKQN